MSGMDSSEESDTPWFREGKPVDRCWLAFLIMYLLGVGSLFPWNAFITPADYFDLRFQDSPFSKSYESIFTSSFTAVGLLTIVALQWLQETISLRTRIRFTLAALFVIFVLATVLAVLPLTITDDDEMRRSIASGAPLQFALLLVCVTVSGAMVAILTGSVIAYASIFNSPSYIQAVTGGQGVAGLTVALSNLLQQTPSLAAQQTCSSAGGGPPPREVIAGAAVYFGSTCAVLGFCLLGFCVLERLPFTISALKSVGSVPTTPITHRRVDDAHCREGGSPTVLETAEPGSSDGSLAVPGAARIPAAARRTASDESLMAGAALQDAAVPLRRLLWKWLLSVTLIYSVTIAVFPALSVGIISSSPSAPWCNVLGPLLFVLFNVGDLIGRAFPFTLSDPNVVLGLCALRVLFVPLFILCRTKSDLDAPLSGSDAWPILIMLVFALSNGWLTTCVFVHSADAVPSSQRQRAGTLTVCFLNTGLAIGASMSFFTRYLVCSCNPFL